MTWDNFVRASQTSGGILYLMAVLLLIALTIILERAWYLRRVLKAGRNVMAPLDAVTRVEPGLLQELAQKGADLPHARLFEAVLAHDLDHSFDRLPDRLDEAIMQEAPHVDRFLWVLDTIVTLAPLMGLLGTILGIFNAFQVLSDPGNVPTKVTGGVAEALLATACGLFIAILGLIAFNGLNNRVRVIMHQLDTLKIMLINRMYPHYHVPVQTGGPRRIRAGEA